ncbi:MAG: thiamine pyrophosphate-dependent dehydrogenase E1 component subunit alpha [Actinobacteria bacterium]|nr:thiamine pyrophosphate-dependent dehydrogenase E1 component subunit alpha [Actinomycetota bacterium]
MAEKTQAKAAGAEIDAAGARDLYRRMRLIRTFEDTVQSQFQKGNVHGTTHLYSGQEASGVGVCSMLRDGDKVAGTYRGHGHSIALGVDPQKLMDEMLGRETGACGGRAGSMNVVDVEADLIGCFGIVGGSIGAATGAALAEKLRRTGNVAVAFFGDGTSNQAYFHESLNWAQIEKLPVIFVCENNLYMEFTPIENVTAGAIGSRPQAMGIHYRQVDGNDVFAVREAAGEAIEHARSGAGPAFLETMTYRFVGHSRSDPGKYRKPGELDEWKKRDPLVLGRKALEERYGLDPERLDQIDAEVAKQLEEIVERGLAAPFPDPANVGGEFK